MMASSSSTQTKNRSPELRKDTVNNQWVIFSPVRAQRPSDFQSNSPQNSDPNSSSSCPFCIGHEHECSPEIFRVPTDPNVDWKIRVIQNVYFALSRDIESKKDVNPDGEISGLGYSGRVVPGFGIHDVVIEAPFHSVHLSDLDPREVGELLLVYKKRIEQIKGNDLIKYIQVFKNHGASSGASMRHSHSQILALPFTPPTVSARIYSMKEYFDRTGKCSLCEEQPKDLQIDVTTHFISVVPFAATFPFEIWIIPRHHSSHFHELDSEKAVDLGGLLKLRLRKIALQLNNPSFNLMIQTSPLEVTDSQLPYSHWFLQIVPRLKSVGLFEIGTGCYINPVFPEDAAKVLREVKCPDVAVM